MRELRPVTRRHPYYAVPPRDTGAAGPGARVRVVRPPQQPPRPGWVRWWGGRPDVPGPYCVCAGQIVAPGYGDSDGEPIAVGVIFVPGGEAGTVGCDCEEEED